MDYKFFFKPDDNSFKTFSKDELFIEIISFKFYPNINS